MELSYRSFVAVEDLQPGECTVHRAADADGRRWWLLWAYVYREDRAGALIDLAVPVNPNGPYLDQGLGGRTWSLMSAGAGRWQLAPSVDAKVTGAKHPGFAQDTSMSLWHQTPTLVDVPEGEAWQVSAP